MITFETLSPTRELALFGFESLCPCFFLLVVALTGDSSVDGTSMAVVDISCFLFFRRSLFFGTSEVSVTSMASDERPGYERYKD